MSQWKITFEDLADVKYEVCIWDGNAEWDDSATTTALEGAAVPFETDEDEIEHPFVPVVGQSGYLRIIVDNEQVLEDLMPTSATDKKIAVWRMGNPGGWVWKGFIQQQEFTQEWGGAFNREIEIPIVSWLSACEFARWDNTHTDELQSIGWIIDHIFTSCLSGSGYTYHLPCQTYNGQDWQNQSDFDNSQPLMGGLKANIWLPNFFEKDDDGGYEMPTCKEMLEKICTYFGWQMREHAADIYITMRDVEKSQYGVNGYKYIKKTSLAEDAQTTDTIFIAPLNDLVQWDGTEHTQTVKLGRKKVTASIDVNIDDSFLNMPDFRELEYVADSAQTAKFGLGSNEDKVYVSRTYNGASAGITSSNYDGLMGKLKAHSYNGGALVSSTVVEKDSESSVQDNIILSNIQGQSSLVTGVVFSSKHKIIWGKSGYLCIKGNVTDMKWYEGEEESIDKGYLKAKIKLTTSNGSFYLKDLGNYENDDLGYTWATTEEVCTLQIYGGQFKYSTHHNLGILTAITMKMANSIYILMPNGVKEGDIQITLYCPTYIPINPGQGKIYRVTGLKLEVKVPEQLDPSVFEDKDTFELSENINSEFPDDEDIDLSMCYNRGWGNGMAVLRKADGDLLVKPYYTHLDTTPQLEGDMLYRGQIVMAENDFWPELYLLKRYKEYFITSRKQLTIQVENNLAITPQTWVNIATTPSQQSNTFRYMVAHRHTDWRNNQMEISFIRL